jgi:hypothetical protein
MAAFLFGVGLGVESLPFPPDAAFSDAVTSHWPNALFLRRSMLDDHTFPLWRPAIMSGQPFAANPLNKVWYPPQWLALVLPPILHLNVLTWLHLVIAGAGARTWSRATGLQAWPSALVGLGYAFGPRLIASAGAGHLDLIYAAAWYPWMLWAAQRLFLPSSPNREKSVGAYRNTPLLGIFAALCLLADVRMGAYALAVTTVYLFWCWWQMPDRAARSGLRRVGTRMITAALLAAGLTAVQWVPLLLYQSDLSRNDIRLEDAAINSLSVGQWLGLLIGHHGGSWETLIYVGISTFTLAAVALLMRPRQMAFWGAILLVIMLYAMGDHFFLWTALNRLIPALRWWRVPPRVWLAAALILPYLAGWGAQLLAESPPDRWAARLATVALFGGGMVCGGFSTITLSSQLELTAVLGLFALPITALIMLLAIFRKARPQAIMLLLTLVVIADVLWIDRTLIEGRDRREWLDPYRELAEYLRDNQATRVYSPSYSLPQQAAAYWRIPQFDGVDPFQLAAYVWAAESATGVETTGYSITIPAFALSESEQDQLDELEAPSERDALAIANRDAPIHAERLGQWLVSHVVSAYEINTPGLELAAQIGDVYIYRNTFAPDATLHWDNPNHVTIRVEEPYTGELYAVAGGRWRDHADQSPGLPGEVDDSIQTWTYEYDLSEIGWSLLAAGGLITLAALVQWKVRRD